MKIFVVGPEKMDTFIHNVAYTFRKMGHEVQSDPDLRSKAMRSRYHTAAVEILSRSSSTFRMRDERRAIQIAKDFRPGLVFVCTRTLEPETVKVIRRQQGCPVVCWYGDPPSNVKYGHITSGEYDAVFVKDRRFADDLCNILGLNAFHLPEACNPDWHKPVKVDVADHLLVAGTAYGYRAAIVERLINSGVCVQLFGPQVPSWVTKSVKESHSGLFLDHTNKALEFSRAIACLNTFVPSERDALNCRIFESCGSGAALVSEHKPAMDEYFEPYKEYLPFSCYDELEDHLNRLRKDNELSQRLRRNAVKRAHGEHTYEHRLTVILNALDMN